VFRAPFYLNSFSRQCLEWNVWAHYLFHSFWMDPHCRLHNRDVKPKLRWQILYPVTRYMASDTHTLLSITHTHPLTLSIFTQTHFALNLSPSHTLTTSVSISLSPSHTHTHKHTHTFSLWHTQWCSYCSPTRYLSSLIFCISWTFLTVGSNKNSRNKIDGILLAKSDESGKWDVINFQKTN